jgi:hypothetical protein
VIFELRYGEAYALWDRAGALWSSVGRLFKSMKNSSAGPNQVVFSADDRYVLSVMLDRISITDYMPKGGAEVVYEPLAAFAGMAIGLLDIQVFTRVAMRQIFAIECRSLDDARQKARDSAPQGLPTKTLFGVVPKSVGPTFKIEADDGELGYSAQIYAREQKMDFLPPPEALVAGLLKSEKEIFHLMLDVDVFTKKPIARESFDPKAWLLGCNKAITRDADAFLDLAGGRS